MTLKRMRWGGHVAPMGEMRNACKILVVMRKEGDHLDDQDVRGWIILIWILERWNGMVTS
jgi:hypothetical protein